MKEITGILVDVYNQKIESKTITYENYDDYHNQLQELLQCKWFDHKQVPLCGINCYCTFDDLGKIKKDKEVIPGVILANEETFKICDFIVGNIWIEKYEGGEDTESLTPEDISYILNTCIDKVRVNNNLTGSSYSIKVLVSLSDWVNITELIDED